MHIIHMVCSSCGNENNWYACCHMRQCHARIFLWIQTANCQINKRHRLADSMALSSTNLGSFAWEQNHHHVAVYIDENSVVKTAKQYSMVFSNKFLLFSKMSGKIVCSKTDIIEVCL